MADWWNAMSVLQQVLVSIAGTATVITIIQTILVIIGFGDGSDVDIDVGEDVPVDSLVNIGSLRIFTLRGIISGLAIGGWLGYAIAAIGAEDWLIIIISIVGMFLSMVLYAVAWRAAMKLQSDGTLNLNNAVGKKARVYIPIPANRSGFGKVTLTVQERFFEADAVTDDSEKLMTESEVEVIGLVDENTLLVKKCSPIDNASD